MLQSRLTKGEDNIQIKCHDGHWIDGQGNQPICLANETNVKVSKTGKAKAKKLKQVLTFYTKQPL